MSYPIDRKALAQSHIDDGHRRMAADEPQQAVQCFETAAALVPGDAGVIFHLGRALTAAGRFPEAEQALRTALELDPDSAGAAHMLGAVLAQGERLVEAMAWLRKAAAGAPNSAMAFRDLAAVELFLGETDAARENFMRALELDVHAHEALFNVVRLTDMSADTERTTKLLTSLNALASKGERLTPAQRVQVHFALAKTYEDRGDYDAAFSWLRQANDGQRALSNYDVEAETRRLRRVAEVFDAPLFQRLAGAGDPRERPIFVMGLPRSGTTLVEQIIAAHPQVYGAGEHIALLGLVQSAEGPGGTRFPEWVATMVAADCGALAETYLNRLPSIQDRTRTTDKRLENFEYVGLIHLLTPNAPIIRLKRDPRDVALSCYALLFTDHQRWSYSFDDIARFWRAYEQLMDHWEQVLPGRMLTVSYEALVGDLEGQARRIIDHCGLPWDDACLSFHTARRPVRSASAAQVRQPIYDTSIGRWRRFAPQMAPLFEAMGLEA